MREAEDVLDRLLEVEEVAGAGVGLVALRWIFSTTLTRQGSGSGALIGLSPKSPPRARRDEFTTFDESTDYVGLS
jgi:hypothetical protein